MPNAERRQWTEEGLKKRIMGCTQKIGAAVRADDDSTANIQRERRENAMRKLALKFNVWTLVNPEGKTEFVDRAEWEQRMIAWGRRNGAIPRARVNLRAQAPPPPPAPPTGGGPSILPPPEGPIPPPAPQA